MCDREERDRPAASIAATPGEVSYREPALMATIQKVSENLEHSCFFLENLSIVFCELSVIWAAPPLSHSTEAA